DDAHHTLHVLLTGETQGYYADLPTWVRWPRCSPGATTTTATGPASAAAGTAARSTAPASPATGSWPACRTTTRSGTGRGAPGWPPGGPRGCSRSAPRCC